MRNRLVALAAFIGLITAVPAWAGHHLWDFTEIFSDRLGTIQYVEIFTADNNEQGTGGFTIACTNTGASVTLANCPTALTANTWILAATAEFASLPGGVTPDYIIPHNFFPTAGGQLKYATTADVWNYGAVPTDGLHALARNASTPVNSPTNFAGQAASIDVSTSVPSTQTWGLLAMVGGILFMGSGLLRKRAATLA